MSSVGLAPRVVVDGPLPVAPRFRLLDVATQQTVAEPHWQAGVNVWPYPPDLPGLWDTCDHGPTDTKNEGGEIPLPSFSAFTVYLPVTCSSFALGGASDELRARAITAFDAVASYGVEQQFSQGVANPLSPYLADANADVLAAGDPVESLALLETAIAGTGRAGVLHATPAVATFWAADSLVEVQQGQLRTIGAGTPVVVGQGYIGADAGAGTPTPGVSEFAFATGPVRYMQSEVFVTTLVESMDRSNNTITFRAERQFVAWWDTVLQAAVLVSRT